MKLDPRSAALIGVVVCEYHAFAGDTVDVRRAVTHQPERVGADVGLTDVIAEDHENVWFAPRACRLLLRLCDANWIP
jgi:hypothetical protein